MKSKINAILKDIELKRKELVQEYEKLKDKYDFSFQQWKVIFTKKATEYNKRFKENLIKYIFNASVKHILSIPFIWMMLIPVLILDFFVSIYQYVCFKYLYNIPIVNRKDFIVYDRNHLDYLNIAQKINCLYCSYVNWFLSYAVEIAWRTEKYWCPIKNAKRNKWWHEWQKFFADYWDPEEFKKVYNDNECFNKKER